MDLLDLSTPEMFFLGALSFLFCVALAYVFGNDFKKPPEKHDHEEEAEYDSQDDFMND